MKSGFEIAETSCGDKGMLLGIAVVSTKMLADPSSFTTATPR